MLKPKKIHQSERTDFVDIAHFARPLGSCLNTVSTSSGWNAVATTGWVHASIATRRGLGNQCTFAIGFPKLAHPPMRSLRRKVGEERTLDLQQELFMEPCQIEHRPKNGLHNKIVIVGPPPLQHALQSITSSARHMCNESDREEVCDVKN